MKPWKRHTNRFEPTSAKHRFNGATAMKPWKRGRWFAGCSIGRKLQWGHGDEAVEESWESNMANELQTRFNGATAMKPWKRRGLSRPSRKSRTASMGPRR